mgnify:FL=1
MFHLLSFISYKNKKMRFLAYHFGAIIIFGLLYWIQDIFLSNYQELGGNLGFGHTSPPADSLYYWMHFSALTQTTVGYAGPVTGKGKTIPFNIIPNNIYKFINMIQLLSVFWITAQLID